MKAELIKRIEGNLERQAVRIWCPGCEGYHTMPIGGPHPCWEFNGDLVKPTLRPSILVRSGHYIPDHKGECWCDFNKKHPEDPGPVCSVCHSFVTDGKIQFLSDSTHKLSGQTVDLPEMNL